jgi:aerobic-type carbon monoxide dehydrogenase small subunit (CoxS/CutS family)
MLNEYTLTVNRTPRTVRVNPDTPLLYILRNDLGLFGPHFGCGGESCGACMVLKDSTAVRSCTLRISEVGRSRITTLEGLVEQGELHPLQQAFLEEQAAQCGYCINGMIISAAALLWKNPHPTDGQIRAALDENLCRCGAHLRILRAVKRAGRILAGEES